MIKSTKIYAYKPQINLFINGQDDFKMSIEDKFQKSRINRYYIFPRNDQELSKSQPIRHRTHTEPNDPFKQTINDRKSIIKGSVTERRSCQKSMRTMPSEIIAEQIIKQFELYKKSKRIYQQRLSAEKSQSRIKQLLHKM